jgi:hypothetical protein
MPHLVRLYRFAWRVAYQATIVGLWPANFCLSLLLKHKMNAHSVLHVSYLSHIPFYTTRTLAQHGLSAHYLAVDTSRYWSECDFLITRARTPVFHALREFAMLWRTVAGYEILHLHFATTMSLSGWELPVLKRMGRKIVIHWRGCEIRDAEQNMELHPHCNICTECDYNRSSCEAPTVLRRRQQALKYGDAFLVTTPDMMDFAPNAEHMPFFAPENLPQPREREPWHPELRPLRIVHATNHPGIEGTNQIDAAIEKLKIEGHRIDFTFLKGVTHQEVLEALADADLSIGKMKMGYYANAQIEAMAMGVPTVTWVRPEFMTDGLRNSGFIFSTLDDLEITLKRYLSNPAELNAKRLVARPSVLALHDNNSLAKRHVALYNRVRRSAQ